MRAHPRYAPDARQLVPSRGSLRVERLQPGLSWPHVEVELLARGTELRRRARGLDVVALVVRRRVIDGWELGVAAAPAVPNIQHRHSSFV